MIFVVGALAILATVQLAVNTSILNATRLALDSEATIDAVSIGQAMIDEIISNPRDSVTSERSFDKVTRTKLVTNPSELTITSLLGPDSGEVVSAYERVPFKSDKVFNDVDDYNHYTRIVTSPHLGDFTVRDSVFYVQESNLDTYSSSQTWYKKIFIKVSHPNLSYPVIVRSLMVYRRYIQPS